MIYIILGPSGCGKGTQAKLLSQKLNLPTFSSGDLLRKAAASGSVEGLKVKEHIDKGRWAPNEITNQILADELSKFNLRLGFVLDGFPRTYDQAVWFEQFLSKKGLDVTKVFHLETTLKESLKRIRGRVSQDLKFGSLRSDETEEAIRSRFHQYLKTIVPIKDYYQKRGKLVLVNNHQPIADVATEIGENLPS